MAGKLRFRKIITLALCMAVLLRVPVLAAQEAAFRLDMDSLNLQKGVSANIVVSLENAQGAKVVSFEGLGDFDIVSQSQSTSTSIINGVASYREDRYFTVMPKTAGEFTIIANVEYNGRTYETNALRVTVSEGSAGGSEPARDLFVNTVISHEEAYSGEKIVVTYELYSRYNIENFGFTDYIAIDGVIAKDMPEDSLMAEYVYLDGNRYAKYEVKQMIIDPVKSGEYTIPSFNLQVNVLTSGGMGGFFSSSTPMYLQTEEKALTVKPLPTEGRPADFSGIVGELQIDGSYSRQELNYGDSFTLQVAAMGNCNLDGLKKITNGGIQGFSIYETQKNTEESVLGGKYFVKKSFDLIFVPETTGVLNVEPISISYFNPVSEKYERAEIPGAAINILGDIPQQTISQGGQTAAVETVRIDRVNYSDAGDGYFTIRLEKTWVYGILIGLAVLIVLAVILIWLLINRKKQDQTYKSLYKQLMRADDVNEIYNLFNAMIKHRYHLSLKASSKSDVRNNLPDAALAAQVIDIMDYMESAKAREDKGYVYLKDKVKGMFFAKHFFGRGRNGRVRG